MAMWHRRFDAQTGTWKLVACPRALQNDRKKLDPISSVLLCEEPILHWIMSLWLGDWEKAWLKSGIRRESIKMTSATASVSNGTRRQNIAASC